MGKPAARITDMHTCPMVNPGPAAVPHVGGPITGPGCPTVLIGGMPAAVAGDMCVCTGPPDTIAMGSATVLIGGKPAVRMGDSTMHGGVIVAGLPTVLIGDSGSGGSFLDGVQLATDEIGLLPGVGELIDGINKVSLQKRGDYSLAAFSAASMIPVIMKAATDVIKVISKAVAKALKKGNKSGDVVKKSKKVAKGKDVVKVGASEFKSVDDLIGAAGKLSHGKSGAIGSVKGNADQIFNNLTKGGTKLESGAFKLKDGSILNLHKSTTTKLPTISINQGGKITKIRITQ